MRTVDPIVTVALAHEQRRRMPLPPPDLLAEDEALRIVRAEGARRAAELATNAYDAKANGYV